MTAKKKKPAGRSPKRGSGSAAPAAKKRTATGKMPAAKKRTATGKKPAAKKRTAAGKARAVSAPTPRKRSAAAFGSKKVQTRICGMCGTTATCAEGGIPSGWTITMDGRKGIEYMCDDCARRNIRAIEGKLPEEWWE